MQSFLDLFISINCSTCFRRFLHPSSGAQNCTYSVRYCQTNTAACCYHGWDGTHFIEINWRKVGCEVPDCRRGPCGAVAFLGCYPGYIGSCLSSFWNSLLVPLLMVKQSVLDCLTFAEDSEWFFRYVDYHANIRCLISQKTEGLNVVGWNNRPQCSNHVKIDFFENIKAQAHDEHKSFQALSQNCGNRLLTSSCLSDRPPVCPPVVRIEDRGYHWTDLHDIY
jgi:hypothetical protein